MKNQILYMFLAVATLSACSKIKDTAAPTKKESLTFVESIVMENNNVSKVSDIYASAIERNNNLSTYSSTFAVNTFKGAAAIRVQLNNLDAPLNTIKLDFENNNQTANIHCTFKNETWSTTLGHQKGSSFEILEVKSLNSASGYVKEITFRSSCFLYNEVGLFIPFSCITSIKL